MFCCSCTAFTVEGVKDLARALSANAGSLHDLKLRCLQITLLQSITISAHFTNAGF
jgi:hypothetical protein